jgi:potassium efflux system protein
MIKLVGLITLSSIWLLPIILPEIQAQQTATLPSTTAPPPSISIEELKSRRAMIESMADIDAAVKTDSLKYIDQAITNLELANSTNQKELQFSQLIQTSPERLRILQQELKKQLTAQDEAARRAGQMSTLELEQRLRQNEAELATTHGRLQDWNDRLAAEKKIINQIPEQLTAAANRLKEIQTELEAISDVTETDVLKHSRGLSLKSEREKSTAEIRLNEQRQRSHNLLIELFSAERDVAQKATENREKSLKSWQVEVQKRRQQEAVRAKEDARDAIVKAPLLPNIVKEQFDINIKLSAELEKITREETELAGEYEGYKSRLKALEQEFEIAQKRVESAVLTEAIGLALRTQRLNLPGTDQYFADSDARKIRLSEISEKQIELDQLKRELSDSKALVDRLISSVSFLSDVDRKSFDLKIRESVADGIDIIEKLRSGYERIFKLIQDIEFTEQKLVNTSEDFGELLDRHLLWIRSSKPVRVGDLQRLKVSLGWFFKPVQWSRLFNDTGRSFRKKPVVWIVGLLIGLFLVVSRRWAHNKLKDIAVSVDQQAEDSFLLTINAMGLTLLLVAIWPFLLAFPAIQLTNLRQLDQFSTGIAGGLIFASYPLIFWVLLYNICRPHGLAQAHFQWPPSANLTLKSNLIWLIPIVAVASFFLGAMETVPEYEYSDALAKLAIMVYSLALSTFFARTLSFSGGISSVLIKKHAQSWLCRLRYVWYPMAILLPLFILWLALIGYYYTAIEIRSLVSKTIVLFLALIVFDDLAQRMLKLARRRIALKKAFADQKLHLESTSGTEAAGDSGGGTQSTTPGTVVRMSEIDEQTQSLLKLAVFILALAGIWTIWEPVFPAFGVLQDIQFWTGAAGNDSTESIADESRCSLCLLNHLQIHNHCPGSCDCTQLDRSPLGKAAMAGGRTQCGSGFRLAGDRR